MKTIIEAFKTIKADPHMMAINRVSYKVDLMENDEWASLIINYAKHCQEEDLAGICARLHIIFEVGVLTGIEMEKQDG